MRNNDLRDRFNSANRHSAQNPDRKDSLFSMWDDQKRMQAEDEKLAQELKLAKAKAKELKGKLREHQLGQSKSFIATKLEIVVTFLKSAPRKIKVQKLPTISRKKTALAGVLVLVMGVGSLLYFRGNSGDQTGLLGDSTGITIQEDLPREKPVFEPLTPGGAGSEQFDIVRISPDEAAPSYTFLDKLTEGGAIFRLTQQEIPENFDLQKTAQDFQATSIIQVDDVIVYHGYSEKGGIQSLLFEKSDKLVSIRSPQKFSDDQWASYISLLK